MTRQPRLAPSRSVEHDDPLKDFSRRDVEFAGVIKLVNVSGAGPAVIVMAEMPGISPHVAGSTLFLLSLFGRDGAVAQANEGAQVFRRAFRWL